MLVPEQTIETFPEVVVGPTLLIQSSAANAKFDNNKRKIIIENVEIFLKISDRINSDVKRNKEVIRKNVKKVR